MNDVKMTARQAAEYNRLTEPQRAEFARLTDNGQPVPAALYAARLVEA